MGYLIDTHVFLWALSSRTKLPSKVISIVEDPKQDLFLSSVSIWEAAIKIRANRLDLEGRTAADLIDEADKMNVRLIPLEPLEAALHVGLRENTHFDPFDRMLIWQAISRKLTLISADAEFKRFKKDGLKLLWN